MQLSRLHAGVVGLFVGGWALPVAGAEPPEHLVWADELIDTVTADANDYGDPAALSWSADNGLGHSTHRAKCASFVSQVLVHAYAVDLVAWFGCTSPHAASYHDAIVAQDGFEFIASIADVQPGDIVAIRYLDADCHNLTCGAFNNCTTSGHVALVAEAPVLRGSTAPIVEGTLQFDVMIDDSSTTPHGSGDTRWLAGENGEHDAGAGRGVLRLYVDADDPALPIVGHAWSTSSGSKYYDSAQRDVAIGRFES